MSDGGRQQFPGMAISDLVVLTLSVGFAFACVAPNYQWALSRGEVTALAVAPDLIDYLGDGLLLFGLIVLVRERVRGSACALSPGQWIIVAIGPNSVVELAQFLLRPLVNGWFPTRWAVFNACDNVLFVLVIGLSLFAARPAAMRLEVRWRICFWMIFGWLVAAALWCAEDAAMHLGFSSRRTPLPRHLIAIYTSFQFLAGGAVVLAAVMDAGKGVRRDWLHWVGVVALLMIVGSALVVWGWSTVRWWRELFYFLGA